MSSILSGINSPADLRKLQESQLDAVCLELRKQIIEIISKKGGHFASNLGSVEITVALHYVFETPNDKIVWDVGHQSYPHKILTGRKDKFDSIRQSGGISGFTVREESEYDHFGAGHASTALSAALGIAEGMRHSGQPHMGIAVVGDGSMTGGLVFEALNNAGHIPAKNLLLVLNDNDMSIDPNVGALQSFINKAVTNSSYNRLRKDLKGLLGSLDDHGIMLSDLAGRVRRSVKNFFTPGMLFECFGFRYFGPVNGHDVHALVDTFRSIKQQQPDGGPFIVHALTRKGKGYEKAEEAPVTYHGVTPFKIETGIEKSASSASYSDIFSKTLIKLAHKDPRIVAITPAMPSGSGLVPFQKEFPTRFYDVGIAEAHSILFAAGLATEGLKPVAAIYSTFLQRAFDQVIHDVCLQNLNVVFAIDRAGCVGADGATHQGFFDLSFLRCVPNIVVMAPKDENELQHMIFTALKYDTGPIAFRYPRGPVVGVEMDAELKLLPIGKGENLGSDGQEVDVSLFAVGFSVQTAIKVAELLRKEGLSVSVINARFIKPLDEDLLWNWAHRSQLVVTIEENTVKGGFGTAVLEMLSSRRLQRNTLLLGINDRYIDHGSQTEQRKVAGLDAEQIKIKILERLTSIPPRRRDTSRQPHETQAPNALGSESMLNN